MRRYTHHLSPCAHASRRAFLALLFLCCAHTCLAQPPTPLATLRLREAEGRDQRSLVITFGQPFPKAAVNASLALRAGDRLIPCQVDVKRRYDDGSIRFAIITAVIPSLPANAEMPLDILPEGVPVPPTWQAPDWKSVLAAGVDAAITFTFPDGTTRVARLSHLAPAEASPRLWLNGPLCREFLIEGPPVDQAGQPDPYLRVQFHVRVHTGLRTARISCVVENCLDIGAGDRDIPYDVTITIGRPPNEQTVYQKKAVRHYYLARWRKIFWWGEPPPQIHLAHDLKSLIASGAVPRYDTTIQIPESVIAKQADRWANCPRDILDNGLIIKYFPTTGGREDIGPYPAWTARYLISQDPRLKDIVLGLGDLAGSFSYHVRNHNTGRLLTIDERPEFWLDERGRDKLQGKHSSPYTVDQAHQPSLAYVPYLVTGDYYYLEEMYFWAGGCLLSQWYVPRENEKGLLKGDQVRGQAWAFRQIVDAAAYAADGDPEVPYFDAKVKNNIAYWTAWATRPNPTPFCTYSEEQYPADRVGHPGMLAVAPWQHDFLVWAMDHAVDQGYADAAIFRDYLLRFTVGRFTNAPDYDPDDGAPYFIIVGVRGDKTRPNQFFSTWKELHQATFEGDNPAERGIRSYGPIARMALTIAVRAGIPRAQEALAFIETKVDPKRVPEDPTWAFAPPP